MTSSDTSRLDVAVQKERPDLSRASAAKLIEAGLVKVNSKVAVKPSFKVSTADKLSIKYDASKEKIESIVLEVIYEDDDVAVINKPAGVLSHSKGTFNPEPTVASWLADRYTGPLTERAGIVHRLDRMTSGVMICAKNPETTSWLQKQFSTRKVKKTYIAIVLGHLNLPKAIIDLPIERNPKSPQSFRVGPGGKAAQTEYSELEDSDRYTMLELRPATGRTHQLRVHLSHLGHPIVGDSLYKGPKANRLYLHALSLELTLPSKERKVFNSPLPKEFKILMSHDRPTN
jgi:23S rRNA pseudouridine1911/1915/1917 synthase